MIQKIQAPISVNLQFNSKARKVSPTSLYWDGKLYKVNKIGLHHKYREGTLLFHIFSVDTETLFFRIKLNTDNLHWTLEEIADGEPD